MSICQISIIISLTNKISIKAIVRLKQMFIQRKPPLTILHTRTTTNLYGSGPVQWSIDARNADGQQWFSSETVLLPPLLMLLNWLDFKMASMLNAVFSLVINGYTLLDGPPSTSVRSKAACAGQCLADASCYSFFHSKVTRTCLLHSSKYVKNEELTASADMRFFIIDKGKLFIICL